MLYNFCSLGLDTPRMRTSLLLDCFCIDSMAMSRYSLFVGDGLALFPLLSLPFSGLFGPLVYFLYTVFV